MENPAPSPYGEYFNTYAATLGRRAKVRRRLLWAALLLLLFVAACAAPVWWHLHQLDVRRAWEQELQEYVTRDVRDAVYTEASHYQHARVTQFIPVLVAHSVGERLRRRVPLNALCSSASRSQAG